MSTAAAGKDAVAVNWPPGLGGRKVMVWLTVALILFGSLCRIAQYFARQSFWHDEAYVVLNLIDKTPRQLMGPLQLTVAGQKLDPQTAPPLYLLVLKWLNDTWGSTELALRLPALVMGLATLPIMAVVAWRTLSPPGALFLVTLCAICNKLEYQSAMVKQYSGDVAAAALMLLVATARRSELSRLIRLAILTVPLLWWSETAIFIFAGMSLALAPAIWRQNWRARAGYLLANLAVAASFALLYFYSMRLQKDPYFYVYWAKFLADWRKPWLLPIWAGARVFDLANFPFRSLGAVVLSLAILGIVALWQDGRRQFLAILSLPILLTFLAACARQYPFGGGRIDLFLFPGLFILLAAGAEWLCRRRTWRWERWWWWLALAPFLGIGLSLAFYYLFVPRTVSHLRPALEFLQKRRHNDQEICIVGTNTTPIFFTYWRQPPGPVVVTQDSQQPAPPITRQFWIIYESGSVDYKTKRKPIIDALTAGSHVLESFKSPTAAAILYEKTQGGSSQ